MEALQSIRKSGISIRIAKGLTTISKVDIRSAKTTANNCGGFWRKNARTVVEAAEAMGSEARERTDRSALAGVPAVQEKDAMGYKGERRSWGMRYVYDVGASTTERVMATESVRTLV